MAQFKEITNKKASHDFTIMDTFEVGMVLSGEQVKQIRAHTFNINGSYVKVWPKDWRQIVLLTEQQAIGLLLHKREIKTLWDAVRIKGMTIVPIKVYLKAGRAKLEIGIAKGKKQYDKRESIKERDIARENSRRSGDY